MIRNYRELARGRAMRDALQVLEAGLAAASPERGLMARLRGGVIDAGGRALDPAGYSAVHVVAFGKSADAMARAACPAVGAAGALVVVPRGSRPRARGRRFRVMEADHPSPTQASVAAARAVMKFLSSRRPSELVLFLVSGGGSSLLCMPDGVDLSDKARAASLLMRAGADIRGLNCVRSHLSRVKGGRLAGGLPCDAAALLMSDVPGDDPSLIASGATYCDRTTFSDALGVISGLGLSGRMPPAVMARLEAGARGEVPETPKRPAIPNAVVARNSDCTAAMAARARQLGYSAGEAALSGDVKGAAGALADRAPAGAMSCLVFGGETSVRVLGGGSGGRNQELVLRLLKRLRGAAPGLVAASVGTDGIDGNTEFAGALAAAGGTDREEADSYLRRSDSSSFFARHGGLVRTGHTGTNLTDVGLLLRREAAPQGQTKGGPLST